MLAPGTFVAQSAESAEILGNSKQTPIGFYTETQFASPPIILLVAKGVSFVGLKVCEWSRAEERLFPWRVALPWRLL